MSTLGAQGQGQFKSVGALDVTGRKYFEYRSCQGQYLFHQVTVKSEIRYFIGKLFAMCEILCEGFCYCVAEEISV